MINVEGQRRASEELQAQNAASGMQVAPAEGTMASKISSAGAWLHLDSGWRSYYLYHPYFRLLVAFALPVLNFLMYGEDPIVHSSLEAEVPVLGHSLNLVFLRYPSALGIALLKIITWVIALPIGFYIGRLLVHHMLLRDFLQIPCCGWKYLDDDDLKPTIFYDPRKTNTPYNEIFWWGDGSHGIPQRYRDDEDLLDAFRSGVHYARGRNILSSIQKVTTEGYSDESELKYPLMPGELDWKDRREYQAEHETFLEVCCPSAFHPRKHRDHNKGSMLVTGLTMALVLTIFAVLYNNFVVFAYYNDANSTADKEEYTADARLGLNEHEWGQMAAVFTWLADLLNMIMCSDTILQELERHHVAIYHGAPYVTELPALDGDHKKMRPWAAYMEFKDSANEGLKSISEAASRVKGPMPRIKLGYLAKMRSLARFWNSKYWGIQMRILIVWLIGLAATLSVIIAISTHWVHWDEWQEETTGTGSTDITRCLLATVIAVLGPLTVLHDWEWPSFEGVADVNVPGINTDQISCGCCSIKVGQVDREGKPVTQPNEEGKEVKGSLPFCSCHLTNRWITFIPFALALCLDFIMLKDTFLYAPGDYGQYTDPATDRICSTRNQTFAKEIKVAFEATSKNPVNYTERLLGGYLNDENGTDFCMPAKYTDASSAIKLLICMPGFLVYIWFVFSILTYAATDRKLSQIENGEKQSTSANEMQSMPTLM